jgi:GNAT superfamily N-acetyltransferase
VLRATFTWVPPERHRAADFLRAARDEEVFVALRGGRIVATAAVFAPQSFIHSLYVDEGERGRGVGAAMLAFLAERFPEPLSLKVQAPNLRAQAFYLREGFRVVEESGDPPAGVAWLRMSR